MQLALPAGTHLAPSSPSPCLENGHNSHSLQPVELSAVRKAFLWPWLLLQRRFEVVIVVPIQMTRPRLRDGKQFAEGHTAQVAEGPDTQVF